MSWFSNIIKSVGSVFTAANPIISGLSSIVSPIIGAVESNQSSKDAARLQREQIAAQQQMNADNLAYQREANAANIASQEKINQQNIDFQREINDIMRSDSLNAVSNKRADLMRAGYSSADPSLSGFSTATLTAPTLTAPYQEPLHTESNFDSSMAANVINARQARLSSSMDILKTIGELTNKFSNTRKQAADSLWQEYRNSFANQYIDAELTQMGETATAAYHSGVLSRKQAERIGLDIDNFDIIVRQMQAQASILEFQSESQHEEFSKRMSHLTSQINDLNASADLKVIEKDFRELEKEIKSIEKDYAEVGINFSSNDIVSSALRMFYRVSSNPELLGKFANNIKQMLNYIFSEFVWSK